MQQTRTLPPPVERYAESPLLFGLQWRIAQYREGRDRLLALGYYAYTTLTTAASRAGRPPPVWLRVSPHVLKSLNDFTSNRIDFFHARKALDPSRNAPLTRAESEWVERAIVMLALRMGEVEAGVTGLPTITMKDLPPL